MGERQGIGTVVGTLGFASRDGRRRPSLHADARLRLAGRTKAPVPTRRRSASPRGTDEGVRPYTQTLGFASRDGRRRPSLHADARLRLAGRTKASVLTRGVLAFNNS